MKVRLEGCTTETVTAIHDIVHLPDCQHEPGNGWIWLDNRPFKEKEVLEVLEALREHYETKNLY